MTKDMGIEQTAFEADVAAHGNDATAIAGFRAIPTGSMLITQAGLKISDRSPPGRRASLTQIYYKERHVANSTDFIRTQLQPGAGGVSQS